MVQIFGALALIALIAVPFWFSRRKKMNRVEDWSNDREPDSNVTNIDTNTTISGDGGHH